MKHSPSADNTKSRTCSVSYSPQIFPHSDFEAHPDAVSPTAPVRCSRKSVHISNRIALKNLKRIDLKHARPDRTEDSPKRLKIDEEMKDVMCDNEVLYYSY